MAEIHSEEQCAWRALEAGEYLESARLYEPLAALGSETALLNLGWMHQQGHLGPADLDKAISFWEKAESVGSASAKDYLEWAKRYLAWARRDQEYRAWCALDAREYVESARLYEPLAAFGSEAALFYLGWMHKKGHLGPPDREKAISLWEKAASAGSVYAKHYLGWAYRKSEPQRARAMFLDGAGQGYSPSMYMAGRMLVRGEGGEPDADAGVAWLTRAADRGHAFARRDLLRREIRNSRSFLRWMWLWGKLVSHGFAVARRAMRNPNSDDFR